MKKYKNRSSVEEKYKWDLTDFFSNEEEFLKTYRKTQKNIEKLSQYVGCTKDAEKLYEFLNLEYLTISLWEDLYVYSYLIHDQELGNAEAIERKNQTEILNLELEKSIHFFSPELLKLSKKDYHQLFLDHPKLKEYQAALDLIYREKGHVLGEEEENIVSSLVSSMNHFDDMSSTMINSLHDYGHVMIDGEDVTIASNNYRYLMHNEDSSIRHLVRDQFQKKLSQYAPVHASFLSSYVSYQNALAKIHHFQIQLQTSAYILSF